MSEISEAIQAKCLAFSDRVIKLNDYLLSQAAMEHEKYKKELRQRKPGQKTSSVFPHPSSIKHHPPFQNLSFVMHLVMPGTYCEKKEKAKGKR